MSKRRSQSDSVDTGSDTTQVDKKAKTAHHREQQQQQDSGAMQDVDASPTAATASASSSSRASRHGASPAPRSSTPATSSTPTPVGDANSTVAASSASTAAPVVAPPPPDPNAIVPSPIIMCTHDMAPHLKLKEEGLMVVGEKGYRMIRATHGIAEGAMYFEIKFLPCPTPLRISGKTTSPAVRVGVATCDADIQAPVGYDIHSYCYRSTQGSKVHNAHVSEYGEGFQPGDVVGVWLVLPPDHINNGDKAEKEKAEAAAKPGKRGPKKKVGAIDRVAQNLAAEEEKAKQEQELLAEREQEDAGVVKRSDAELVQSRKFHKRSFIRFFKNGIPAGSSTNTQIAQNATSAVTTTSENAFSDILRAKYFPAVSLYMGASVRVNFGPDWWCPPEQVMQGVAASLTPIVQPTTNATSTNGDVVMTDAASSTLSASPLPPALAASSSTSSSPAPIFRHPLNRTLLTSGLFPHLDGSGSTLLPNPHQIAANQLAAEEAKAKAQHIANELARKAALKQQPQAQADATQNGGEGTTSSSTNGKATKGDKN